MVWVERFDARAEHRRLIRDGVDRWRERSTLCRGRDAFSQALDALQRQALVFVEIKSVLNTSIFMNLYDAWKAQPKRSSHYLVDQIPLQ